ncbi:hypothetical protein GQ55_5G258000 [Panicum hallii var. hallii]|uniref:Uncharacterized protein n=1 Tax=Panicum hallii var. hallii TaxID=1504633 RepID=A0A2T7DK83_9POAL|nr:hypothetical protein GQ55_5G258000 [Panicum hallii var. hallii]
MSPRGRVAPGAESTGTRVLAPPGWRKRQPIPARHAPTVAWPPFDQTGRHFARCCVCCVLGGGGGGGGRGAGRTRVAPHRGPDPLRRSSRPAAPARPIAARHRAAPPAPGGCDGFGPVSVCWCAIRLD